MEVHKKVHEMFKNRRSCSPSKKMCVVDKIEPKNYSQAEPDKVPRGKQTIQCKSKWSYIPKESKCKYDCQKNK